jgi:hypothetical protein
MHSEFIAESDFNKYSRLARHIPRLPISFDKLQSLQLMYDKYGKFDNLPLQFKIRFEIFILQNIPTLRKLNGVEIAILLKYYLIFVLLGYNTIFRPRKTIRIKIHPVQKMSFHVSRKRRIYSARYVQPTFS